MKKAKYTPILATCEAFGGVSTVYERGVVAVVTLSLVCDQLIAKQTLFRTASPRNKLLPASTMSNSYKPCTPCRAVGALYTLTVRAFSCCLFHPFVFSTSTHKIWFDRPSSVPFKLSWLISS